MRWQAAARTIALSTAFGALAGVVAGAEELSQRPLVMGITAAVGFAAGVFLVLIPRQPSQTPPE